MYLHLLKLINPLINMPKTYHVHCRHNSIGIYSLCRSLISVLFCFLFDRISALFSFQYPFPFNLRVMRCLMRHLYMHSDAKSFSVFVCSVTCYSSSVLSLQQCNPFKNEDPLWTTPYYSIANYT